MASLLIVAVLIPLITINRVQAEEIQVELQYRYEYSHWDYETPTIESYSISVAATLDNLSLALRGEEVRGYPLWMNVSDWSVYDTVQLANATFTVTGFQERYGLYCWKAETQNGTSAYYHREFGVFLGSSFYDATWMGGLDWRSISRSIDVTRQNLEDFHSISYVFNPDAVLLAFILIEVAAFFVIHDKRTIKGSASRKS